MTDHEPSHVYRGRGAPGPAVDEARVACRSPWSSRAPGGTDWGVVKRV
jgi:hypothetical protein